jgi:hypothetical protein
LIAAAKGLRDAALGLCQVLDPDDDFVNQLMPEIDKVDDAMREATEWVHRSVLRR